MFVGIYILPMLPRNGRMEGLFVERRIYQHGRTLAVIKFGRAMAGVKP